MFKISRRGAIWLMLLTVATGIGLLQSGTRASAKITASYPWKYGLKKNYSWKQPKDAAPVYYTKVKKTQKSAYIWNKKFTKKTHNLKNFPYHTWYVQQSFKRNRKVYYKVYGGKVSGYVWHGYLTPAISRDLPSFTSNKAYVKYLKTNPSQRLSRALLKYFPNATVDLALTRHAAGQYVNSQATPLKGYQAMTLKDYQHVIDLTKLHFKVTTSRTVTDTYVQDALMDPVLTSNAKKAKQVNKILVKNGYTQKKIASLINQGYKLGIYMNDNTGVSAAKSGYPWTINTAFNVQNDYGLCLAK